MHLPLGKGILGQWAKLASKAAFRKGKAFYCGYRNEISPGMWAGGIVGLKSILNAKSRAEALGIMDMGTVAFTGYRPNKLPFAEDKKDELYLAFRKRLRQVIDRLVERGYTEYVSGVAMGFDTWVAEDVIEVRKNNPNIRLECAIPCPNQDKNWSFWDKVRRKKILYHADSKPVICEHYNDQCFHIRNRYMVDKADVVVCCYDGQKGGTGYTVNYALKADKIVVQINPNTTAVTILSRRNFDQ